MGYGSGGYWCDSCRVETTLKGWGLSGGIGWALSHSVQLGAEGHWWSSGLANEQPTELIAGSVLASFHSRPRSGPFAELGIGLSHFRQDNGTAVTDYSGTGWGFTLGAGWGVPLGKGEIMPRLAYTFGYMGNGLHTSSGAAVGSGWHQYSYVVELGYRWERL